MMLAFLLFVLTAAALLVWSSGGARGGSLAVPAHRSGDDDADGGAERSVGTGVFARWRRRDRAAEAMQWVTVVRRLAALLQAGRAPARVFGELPAVSTGSGPTGRWIARMCGDVHAAAQVGIPVSASLTRFASAPVPAGDRAHAATARSECAQLAAVRTLAWLPVLALGLGVLMGTDPITTLLTTWWGRLALAAGAALSIAGRLWTRALMHRAEVESAS